jgi:hypothetical protein
MAQFDPLDESFLRNGKLITTAHCERERLSESTFLSCEPPGRDYCHSMSSARTP